MPRSYALFDLDHTLLPFDTQALFCNFVLHRHPWRIALHALFIPFALARACGLCTTEIAKRAFLSYLWGMKRSRIKRLAMDFAHDCVRTWIYPELRAEILRHRHQGRGLILNTASPDLYAQEIADMLEFDHCVSTRLQPATRIPFLPKLEGPNNKHEAKIRAMIARVPGVAGLSDEERFHCWSYSDSHADIPLLEFAGNRILVHPSAILRAHFPEHDVTILTPERPYWTKVGDMLCVLRQMFGLHREVGPER